MAHTPWNTWNFGGIDTRNYRCVDGCRMRHDPQPDDPYFEVNTGPCPICDGEGCPEDEAA